MNKVSHADCKVGFIGAGNIARSLVSGLMDNGWQTHQIAVSDPSPDQLDRVLAKHPVSISDDNSQTAEFADILILAVKPQIMGRVCQPLAKTLHHSKPLVLSVAAGIAQSHPTSTIRFN